MSIRMNQALARCTLARLAFFRPASTYARVQDDDVRAMERIIGNKNDVITSQEDLQRFNQDWTRQYTGEASLALRPSSTEQVASILRYCNERRLAVTTQGGNTGLVAGAVPSNGEIVLSLEKMRRRLSYDKDAGIMTVEGGCILEDAENWAKEHGFLMPLDLGAKGSCTVGGNVATNAGGVRFLRFGSMHGNVLGLKVVLADGTILDDLHRCRKDNTGYDLKHLFIGSEGTLGVITGVSIVTPQALESINVVVLVVKELDMVSKIFHACRTQLGEILSAFELWDSIAHELARKHFPAQAEAIQGPEGAFFVLIETRGSNTEHDQQKVLKLVEDLQGGGLILDGIMAQDETQCLSLWSIRENLPEACAREGPVLKYDLSLSPGLIYRPITMLRNRLSKDLVDKVVGFGHYGDGNIHVNIIAHKSTKDVEENLQPFIYEWVRDHHGSISAEHGIGLRKAPFLSYARTSEEIQTMYKIKHLLDPNWILNPGKVLLSND